jgi:hypothetical protein
VIIDTGNKFTFAMPAAKDGDSRPKYGTVDVRFTGNGKKVETTVNYLPPEGYNYVTLAGTLVTSSSGIIHNFNPAAAVTDQIAAPEAITLGATGIATASEAGTFLCQHVDASAGKVLFFNLIVDEDGVTE